ncbi:MAG: type II toxin-antitoxin system Phd/YefM family antitoxin [Candidatus Eremiobacteraeota bacterium]|nr:type II toxin-antitoxin system Phd/YefM family antitoxin [Candidatus Eremiobacteraeota bacterium]
MVLYIQKSPKLEAFVMAEKMIKTGKVRAHLGRIMEDVHYKGDSIIIERGKRQIAAIISIEEYRLLQRQREEDFSVISGLCDRNADLPPEEIEKDVHEAVKDVRRARHRT